MKEFQQLCRLEVQEGFIGPWVDCSKLNTWGLLFERLTPVTRLVIAPKSC